MDTVNCVNRGRGAMKKLSTIMLLPDGLQDTLPPDAEAEAQTTSRLLETFASFGYQRVAPPLAEFEGTFLEGPGAAVGAKTFRMVDPLSQEMLCVRPDITPQIARIAESCLSNLARPLRLSYAGHILRGSGTQLYPERQFSQVGVELIGDSSLAGDVEVILLAHEALSSLGVADISIDLTIPTLVPIICRDLGLGEIETSEVRRVLDRKDTGSLKEMDVPGRELFESLMLAAGPANTAIEKIGALNLPNEAGRHVALLEDLVNQLRAFAPSMALTVDPGEFRGVEYHTGVAFNVFSRGARGELCGGGRYCLYGGEKATGFTIYMESLQGVIPNDPEPSRIYIPFGGDAEKARQLRRKGWRTVAGLQSTDSERAEAVRLGCTHIFENGEPQLLDG